MNPDEQKQNRIQNSQGVRLNNNDLILKPRNRIEAAIKKSSGDTFLPSLKNRTEGTNTSSNHEPLKTEAILTRSAPVISTIVPNTERDLKPKDSHPFRKIKIITRVSFSLLVALLAISAIGFGGYKGVKTLNGRFFSAKDSPADISWILKEVSKLVEIPAGEDPSIFTVADLAPLKNQAFFNEAKIGDKVLIFSKSKKAILYRPSENRIIVMAPLNN